MSASANSEHELPPPLNPENPPPLDRYCDLVMKGGVVDGVIYPGAMLELARAYRFKNIGGTSVGAIAATLLAAAEYCRRFGSDDGFNEVLRKIPDRLAYGLNDADKQTRIRSLFQPEPALERLFQLLVDAFSSFGGSQKNKITSILSSNFTNTKTALNLLALPWLIFKHYWQEGIFAFMGGGLVYFFMFHGSVWGLSHLLFGGFTALMSALFLVLWGIYQDFLTMSNTPGFGLCSGLSKSGSPQGLIEWLHEGIQGAAKLPLNRPLTFNDLWSAPGGPTDADGRPSHKSIDLRMISSAVSHGRPYELPVLDPATSLFFKIEDLRRYFPDSVLAHLQHVSKKYADDSVRIPLKTDLKPSELWNSPNPSSVEAQNMLELPVGELPVIVAVRLSMNFPVLFQAVPLWAIDNQAARKPIEGQPKGVKGPSFRKIWFSDGGITANFPIHFFDAALPRWPTFGIYLSEKSSAGSKPDDQRPLSRVTEFHTQGRSERWNEIGNGGLDSFVDYLNAIFVSMKDWTTAAALRMPDIRDRVATIYTGAESAGGLNLNIKGQQILNYGYLSGTQAGKKLVRKFVGDTPPQPSVQESRFQVTPGWQDHRWIRFNALVAALRGLLSGFNISANRQAHTLHLPIQIKQAGIRPPLYFENYFESILTSAQMQALHKASAAIAELEASLASTDTKQPYVPIPQAELKARPRI